MSKTHDTETNIKSVIADPNYIVVPTGGCWTRADFAEVINRSVLTKAIIALDLADPQNNFPNLVAAAANVIVNDGNANTQLGSYLNKLVKVIISNNGVISSGEPNVFAYVYEYNTQQIIANSTPPSSMIPVAPTSKFDVINNNGNLNSVVKFESLLVNPSPWFEFVAPDVLDPTNQAFSYRSVYYVGEFYRLLINIRLTPVPVLYPCVSVSSSEDTCDDESVNGDCIESLTCNWKIF